MKALRDDDRAFFDGLKSCASHGIHLDAVAPTMEPLTPKTDSFEHLDTLAAQTIDLEHQLLELAALRPGSAEPGVGFNTAQPVRDT